MNENDTDPAPDEGASTPTDRRPLAAWLRLVDALITREFTTALAGEDVSRRDWMLLNALSGTVDAPWMTGRLAHRGKHVRRLAERGWITTADDGAWQLTEDGRAARDRLAERVDAVRQKVAGAVAPDQFAQLQASLEAIARELGWDESQPMPRGGRGRRPGFGGTHAGFHPGFAPERGFGRGHGRRPGFAPDVRHDHGPWHHDPDGCEHGPHAGWGRHAGWAPDAEWDDRGFGPGRRGVGPGHHEHLRAEFERRHHGGRDHRRAERAYERGFAAGFSSGRTPGAPAEESASAD
nr:hypothetical protein [Microbacterium bovistercoris]